MKVREIMTRNPACCTREDTLVDAARLMKINDCGAIPVIEDEESYRPIGIITDRDIVVRGLAADMDPMETIVEDCMTRSLVSVQSYEEVEECVRLMEEHQLRRILVIDNDGSLVGIVAQAQVVLNVDSTLAGELVEDISERR